MTEFANIYESSGAAVRDTAAPMEEYTIEKYLYGCINIDVPQEAIVKICLDRDIDPRSLAIETEKSLRDLLKADLLVWMAFGVSRRGAVSDTDNGWTHSDGGYSFTDADKKLFLSEANKIYADNGESTVGRTKAIIHSNGIKPANMSCSHNPLPYKY